MGSVIAVCYSNAMLPNKLANILFEFNCKCIIYILSIFAWFFKNKLTVRK